MCCISTALLPVRPTASLTPADAISAFQIGFPAVEAAGDFPNGLRCDRQILCMKVCHSTPHQISLFCSTLKNESDYVIIPENPCITYKQVCLNTGEENHLWTLIAYVLASDCLWIQLVSTLFSQSQSPINYSFGMGSLRHVTWSTDTNVFQWLSRLLSQVQTRATHSQSSHFADWMTIKRKWKKQVNLQIWGAFVVCHAGSEMINNHNVYWSSLPAIKIIQHCHFCI